MADLCFMITKNNEQNYYNARKLEYDLDFQKRRKIIDTISSFNKDKFHSRNFLCNHTCKP